MTARNHIRLQQDLPSHVAATDLALSRTQQGIWYAEQIAEKHQQFVISHSLNLPAELDVSALIRAIVHEIRLSPVLHARFIEREGLPRQIIPDLAELQQRAVTVDYIDLRQHPRSWDEAHQLMQQDSCEELMPDQQGVGFRQLVLHVVTPEGQSGFIWYQRFHHIVLDGFSFHALTRRILERYQADLNDDAARLEIEDDYLAVLEEQAVYENSAQFEQDRSYWQASLPDLVPAQGLLLATAARSTQLTAPPVLAQRSCAKSYAVLQRLADAQKTKARLYPADFMMALCCAYLAAMTGQHKISLGLPMMRRLGSAAANSLLPAVSVLPLTCEFQAGSNLVELASALREDIKALRRHQQFDAELIQRERQQHFPEFAQQSLYSAVINYKMFDTSLQLGVASCRSQALATGPVDQLELSFSFAGARLHLELRAPVALFSQADLAAHAEALLGLVQSAADLSELPLAQWQIGPAYALTSISEVARGPSLQRAVAIEHSFSELILLQAQQHGAATALHHAGKSWSYAELAQQSSQLARYLQAQGALTGSVVGMALPRSERALIALLAIMHTGATLLPLDLDYPAERLAMMCEDAKPVFILSETTQLPKLPAAIRVCCADSAAFRQGVNEMSASIWTPAERAELLPDSVAYLIFTSGSTGRPKGVMNTHAALLNLIDAHKSTIYQPALLTLQQKLQRKQQPLRPLRAAHTHSFSFDSSWLQLFWLAHGQALYLFDETTRRDADGLVQAIREQQLDSLDLPPSFLAQMINCGLFAAGQHHPSLVLIGGEAAPASLWQALREVPDLQAHNLYGPTEYTVDTLRADIKQHQQVVLGRPIANTTVYVLDAFLRPVLPGVTGELYLSGAGLAKAYLARADLSATRFVANPFYQAADGCSSTRMYRTGDLVRWSQTGELEFLGRSDDQIKIRGYRVEIAEVEQALAGLAGVESALVLAERAHHSQRILGFVVLPDLVESEAGQRAQAYLQKLRQTLPDYMVPARLLVLAEFPRNVSGKIDRRALLELSQRTIQPVLPETTLHDEDKLSPAERCLVACVAKVLQLEGVTLEADFFALGGDSISAIVICTQLRSSGYLLKPRAVFEGRILARIASEISALPAADQMQGAAAGDAGAADLITQQRLAEVRHQHPEVADLAQLLPLQAGMLFHAEYSGSGRHYNAHTALSLSGVITPEKWQAALDAVLADYPQLAARVWQDAQQSNWLLLADTASMSLRWPFQFIDLTSHEPAERGQRVDQIASALLTREPRFNEWSGLIDAVLIKTADQQAELLIMVHHMLTDGWSSALIFNALCRHYQQLSASAPRVVAVMSTASASSAQTEADPLRTSSSYARLVRQLLARPSAPASAYWQTYLQDSQACLLFSNSGKATEPASVREFHLSLPLALCERLQQNLRQQGLTLNVLMQAMWGLLLQMYSGRNDVVFGAPVAGRDSAIPGIADEPGLFLSTLPVRLQINPQQNLWQQLGLWQQQHLRSMEHDNLPLAEILRVSQLGEGFDTLLVVENYPDHDYLHKNLGQGETAVRINQVTNRGYSHYPLALLVLPGQTWDLLLESRVPGLDGDQLLRRLSFLLEQALRLADQPLLSWQWCMPDEVNWLASLNQTAMPVSARHLPELLLCQRLATPDAPALSDANAQLSYLQMHEQVQTLAYQLHSAGVQSGAVVAIALPRSVLLTIAIHAVVAMGAVYLPLDSNHPDARLAYMLTNADAAALITDSPNLARSKHWQAAQSDIRTLILDELFSESAVQQAQSFASTLADLQHQLQGDDGAYLIYTSGTTGQPKGALLSHAAIVNRLCWMQAEYRLQTGEVVLQKTPSGFDVSVWEFFWPFICGARLHMAEPEAHKEPAALLRLLQQHQITCLHFVPSMLAMFCQYLQALTPTEREFSHLRLVFCSGEALTSNLAREFMQYSAAALHNLYGPTEAAVDVSYADVAAVLAAPQPALMAQPTSQAGSGTVTIGKPVWNTQLHVLDPYLRPLPVGAMGELYLAGVQLAQGYLARAALTASRFVANPWHSGQRMYRTGDLVRYLANGDIDYLGRGDDQLKLRGMRIELAEIEAVLLAFPGLAQVAVQAMVLNQAATQHEAAGDQRQLVAYLVARENAVPDLSALRQFAQQRLPAHMLPLAYQFLPALPLSANGKLDRRALPQNFDWLAPGQSAGMRAPAAGLESKLATLFCQILGVAEVGAEQSFFDLGGHSLLAMRLAAEIRRVCQRQISVGQIILHPSVAQLAERLNQTVMLNDFGEQGYQSSLALKAGTMPALFCFYPGSGFAWQYSVLGAYVQTGQALIGLQSPRPDGLIARSANMAELVDAQLTQIRQLQAEGPYYLLGYSLGGSVAYAVAARLRQMGQQVAWLGLLDTYPAEVHSWDQQQGEQAQRGAEQEQARLIHDAMRADGELDADLRLEKEKMLSQIFANYQDAVRLLSATTTPAYDQPFTVFVAQASLPDYIQPEAAWASYASQAQFQYLADCSHEDILSPANLQKLGPMINRLLSEAQQTCSGRAEAGLSSS